MINAEYISEECSRFETVEHLKNLPAIPPEAKPDWSEVFTIEIRENNERLLPLSLAEDQILVRPAYFSAGIEKHYRIVTHGMKYAKGCLLPTPCCQRDCVLSFWMHGAARKLKRLFSPLAARLLRRHILILKPIRLLK